MKCFTVIVAMVLALALNLNTRAEAQMQSAPPVSPTMASPEELKLTSVVAQAVAGPGIPEVKSARLPNLPDDLVLPEYKLVPIAEAITALPKGLVGVHVGKWNDVLNFALIVEEVYTATTFKGHYAWGVAPEWRIDSSGSNTIFGEIKKNKLIFSRRGETEKHEYKMKSNGELDGEVTVYNADGTRRGGSTAKMRRVAP